MKVVACVMGLLPLAVAAPPESCSSAVDAPAIANVQLQVKQKDRLKESRGNTEIEAAETLRTSASTVLHLHSAAEKARSAAQKMQSQWDASVNEINHLLGGFENHVTDSQDGCGSQLVEYQHQLQINHQSLTSIYVQVNETESNIYLHDHECKEKYTEISVLKDVAKKRYQKCETEISSSKKTLSVLKADLHSMQQLSSTSVMGGSAQYGHGTSITGGSAQYGHGGSVTGGSVQYGHSTSITGGSAQYGHGGSITGGSVQYGHGGYSHGGYAPPRPVYGLLQMPQEPPSEERVAGVQSMVQETHDLSKKAEQCVAKAQETSEGQEASEGDVVFLETSETDGMSESEEGPYRTSVAYPGKPSTPGAYPGKPVPSQCQEIIIELQHTYSEAYVSLTRLIEEYEVVTHSTVCTDTVREEYEKQVNIVQTTANQVCYKVEHEIKDLEQYKIELQTSQATELKLQQSIQVLTKQCGGLHQTETYLHFVSGTITALGNCVGLDNLAFKIPTWVGSWTTFRQDRHKSFYDNDQYMNQACVEAYGGSFGEVRAAEMSEIDTQAIEEMPATNTHNLPLLGACPSCKGDENDNSKEGYGRLCWDSGTALTHDALRGDCNSGERAVLCVYDGQSSGGTTNPPSTTEPPVTTPPPPVVTPQSLMTCDAGEPVSTTSCMTAGQYDLIVQKIKDVLTELDTQHGCQVNSCPQADWAGCVLRMAGHDFMDFANGQGGSDACTDMNHPDNAGLAPCLAHGEFGFSLNQIYASVCTQVSLADFLVISAEGVMSVLREKWIAKQQVADPSLKDTLDFKSNFRFGRTTATSEDCAMGELPNPEGGCDEFDRVFVQNMGLELRLATALMGVHTLGRAKPENSGYDGWWSDVDNSRLFNNNYFVSLLAKGWMPERLPSGKHQWTRSDLGADPRVKEMMLNTDICFLYKEDNSPVNAGVELSGFGQPCCAWVDSFVIGGDRSGQGQHTGAIKNNGGEFCGTDCTTLSGCQGGGQEQSQCCAGQTIVNDCGSPMQPSGDAAEVVMSFASDDLAWASAFGVAWKKATENGFGALQTMPQVCPVAVTG